MIHFKETVLKNGLKVIAHQDKTSPLVAVNVLYKVGSRNENPNQTGIAHLFEHLMFSGSENVDDFDQPLQIAGGENNAFTNADITNYYDVVPAENIETALWLESDRMASLNLSEKNVNVQKKVVLEEFSETCLNKPYGDTWHYLSEMCYKRYAYRWPTIGLNPKHVESITRNDALAFYAKFYKPNNAILSISGNIEEEHAFELARKWFDSIPGSEIEPTVFENEIEQTQKQVKTVYGDVPNTNVILAFPMPNRLHPDYYSYDILSDILGMGKSNRLHLDIVENKALCSQISTYVSGTDGPGLFIIDAKPNPGVAVDDLLDAIWKVLNELTKVLITQNELQKVKNGVISHMAYSETSVLSKAISLAYFENIGDVHLINRQIELYSEITAEKIKAISQHLFQVNKSNVLIYCPREK